MVIEKVFFDHRTGDERAFYFTRPALKAAGQLPEVVKANKGQSVANDGDVLYAYRFRRALPQRILDTQTDGLQWRIQLAGRARYRFVLSRTIHIAPNAALITIKVPDATPEIIAKYALNDEQALLAKVRYNRLIDIFLGITAYSLQNHLRTSVEDIGQIEIDELYVGIDKNGRHYVVPVQAKGGSDKLSPAQAEQDIAFCAERYAALACRAVSAQFMTDDRIALMELAIEEDQVRVVDEKHYKLVAAADAVPNQSPGTPQASAPASPPASSRTPIRRAKTSRAPAARAVRARRVPDSS
jgi:hypothetical protein